MIDKTYIYLVTNCYNDPYKVYIGKTKNSRLYKHKRKYGKKIIYTIIDEINSLDKKDWKPLESYWIEQFKQWGFEVLNKNNGGGGPSFLNDEQKNIIRIKILNRPKEWIKSIKGRNKIPIIQYDLDGNYIREWSSLLEACNNFNIDTGTLCCCLKGRQKTCKGYVWKYKNEKDKNPSTKRNRTNEQINKTKKPINQYDINMNFISSFGSILEASKYLNISDSYISSCIKKAKPCKKYIFKFVS